MEYYKFSWGKEPNVTLYYHRGVLNTAYAILFMFAIMDKESAGKLYDGLNSLVTFIDMEEDL